MEFLTQKLIEICDFIEKSAHCRFHRPTKNFFDWDSNLFGGFFELLYQCFKLI